MSARRRCPRTRPERERFLGGYRVRRRDIEDAVNQMLRRDPEQHQPPRLSWSTLIQRLAEAGIDATEAQLSALPLCCEFTPELQAQFAAHDS